MNDLSRGSARLARTDLTAADWTEVRTTNALPGAEFLRAHYTTHAFPVHAHPEFLVALVRHGAERFECAGKSHVAPRGSLVLINPFEAHTGRAASIDWAYSAVFIEPRLFQSALYGAGNERERLFFSRPVVDDIIAVRLFMRLERQVRRNVSALAIQSVFAAFAARIASTHCGAPLPMPVRRDTAVQRVKRRIDEDPGERLDLSTLACTAGLPPLTLLRRFRSEIGCTPHVYRTTQRLSLAKRLLRHGASPAMAATEAGFADQAHLTRIMRRCCGLTPKEQATLAV